MLGERPEIVPQQWITVGMKKVVVSFVHDEGAPADCTVVYLDERNRPMYAEVTWTEHGWAFVTGAGPRGAAHTDDRWHDCVTIVRAGVHASPPRGRTAYPTQRGTALTPSPRR
jgi:hypothetical protein